MAATMIHDIHARGPAAAATRRKAPTNPLETSDANRHPALVP